jgi:hypothetical protein
LRLVAEILDGTLQGKAERKVLVESGSTAAALAASGAGGKKAAKLLGVDEHVTPKYLGEIRACLQMVGYDGPARDTDDIALTPVQLRVKVLRARGLAPDAKGSAIVASAQEVNPLVRITPPKGRQLRTRTLERTAEPEWGDKEVFLFPAPSGTDPFLLQVESHRKALTSSVLGIVSIQPQFFTVLPKLLIRSQQDKQKTDMHEQRKQELERRRAEEDPEAPGGGRAPSKSSSSTRELLASVSSSAAAAAAAATSSEAGSRPDRSRVPPLSSLGISQAPSPEAILNSLPVYSAPIQAWFPLRDPSGSNDGTFRGEVQLEVSWEPPEEGATRGPDAPRKVGYDALSDMGDNRPGGNRDGDSGRVGGREVGQELSEEELKRKEQEDAQRKLLEGMELKDGDYRILVHIVQAKDLHPEDPNGTADPCVFAEVLGQKQHTRTMWARTSCVFDHIMWFDFKGLSKQEIETATIRVSVFDVDMIASNDLIGEYSFDAAYVYFREHHELHHQWIGLSDPTNSEKQGVQGFLKLSVAVLGPGDKRNSWDPRDEEREAAEEADKGITAKLLMPPAVERKLEFLVVGVHLAEHLPALDAPQLFGLIQGGIDAFVQVDFGGGTPARTRRETRKGVSGQLDPIWPASNELWIPVLTPTMSTRVRVTLWDEDFALFGNQLCSTIYLDYARIRKRAVVRKWFNLYGASAFASGEEADRMNEYPDFGVSYRGRMLLSARVVTDESEMEGHPEEIHSSDAGPVLRSLRPPTQRYELRALVLSATELPQRTALLGALAETLGLTARNVGIEVCVGPHSIMTTSMIPKHRQVVWGELLGVGQHFELPSDVEQIPDVFVYLFRGSGARRVNVSFLRFKAKDLLSRGFSRPASWLHLDEDQALNAIPDEEQPGSVLMRLGFGTVDSAAAVDDWEGEAEEAERLAPYEVRVHVYQGRNLIATDSNGSTDPWVKVQVAGATGRTRALQRTTCPLWYETITLRLELPQREEFLPEILVQLWDENLFARDVKVSQLRIPLGGDQVPKHRYSMSGATDLPEGPPLPTWRPLSARNRDAEGPQGEVLVSAQLIALDSLDVETPPIPSLRPRTQDWFVEIVALGLRDLKPYLGFPIYDPCVEFDVGDRRDTGGIKATEHSKLPSGTNPNFGERILIPIKLPLNPIFAPSLNLTVKDRRLGGWSNPIVATSSISLTDKYPAPDGRPVAVEGSVVAEDPHINELEEGEVGPDPARMAVKAAAKRQQREDNTKRQRKLHKKMRRRHLERAAAAAEQQQGGGGGDPTQPTVSGEDTDPASQAGSVSDEWESGSGSGSFVTDDRSTATSHGPSVKGSVTVSHAQYDPGMSVLPDEAGNDSSEVEDVSTDEEPDERHTRHLRKAGKGKAGGATKAIEAEAAQLLKHHKMGTAASVRSSGSRRAPKAMVQTPSPATSSPAVADPSQARAMVGMRAEEAVEQVVGDHADDVDFGVFRSPDEGGGLAAVAASTRDVSAEGAAPPGDLSWLYRHLKRADAADGLSPEDKAVGYLSGRREYDCGLEEALVTAPFETFDVRRGSALPRGSIFGFKLRPHNTRVGQFKGIVRIIKDPRKTPPPVALESLLRPEQYLVRVYVLNGRDMMPMDAGGTSDPYLTLSLGNVRVSDRANYVPRNLNPGFFRCYELKASLPGPSRLHITTWDYDLVTFDDLIGETVIDLEDRWFDPRWQSFGMERQTAERLAPKPLEDRSLFAPTFFGATGQLKLWVDILRPSDAAKYPKLDITPPPPRKFQFRVIIWRARDVVAGDALTKMNDLYCRCWLEGQSPRETDTHWRAKGGKGSFNWRFKWDVELPYDFPILNLQLWDRDILKWNDCLAEVNVDLRNFFTKARFVDKPYQVFDDNRRKVGGGVDPDDVASPDDPARVLTSDSDDSDDDDSDDDDERQLPARRDAVGAGDDGPVTASAAAASAKAPRRKAQGQHGSESSELLQSIDTAAAALVEEDAGDPTEEGSDDEREAEKQARLEKMVALARRKAARLRRKQRAKARRRFKRSPTEDAENIALDLVPEDEKEKLLRGRDTSKPANELDSMAIQVSANQEKTQDAEETISNIKSLLGFPSHPKAEHAKWIPCMSNYVNGKYQPHKQGEVLVSAELVPMDMVETYPAGLGRSEPNMNPHLPPPAGRLRFSLNPFYLGNAFCGPGLFQRCMLCFCIIVILTVLATAGPAIDVGYSFLNSLGEPWGWIVFGAFLVFCCGPFLLMCIRSCVRQTMLAVAEARPDAHNDGVSLLGDNPDEIGVEKGAGQSAQGAESGEGGPFGQYQFGDGEPDYGYMEDEEKEMFLRDAAIITRAKGLKRLEAMNMVRSTPVEAADSKQLPADAKADER